MNVNELSTHWATFNKKFGIGYSIRTEEQYEELLEVTEQLMDLLSADGDDSVRSLVSFLADRIREYEDRVHPWPNTTTPAQLLRFLMDQHGFKQTDLSEIGSQGVVSEILNGKRELNARQIEQLSKRFHVSPAVFFPAYFANDERFALAS